MKSKKTLNSGNIFAVLAILFMLSACFSTNSTTGNLPENNGGTPEVVMGSTIGNYEDIEIPVDMKYIYKDSTTIRTESFRGGIIHYKGPVDAYSLKDYFVSSMKKHNWKLAGEVAGKNIILAFTKPHRTCMVQIEPNYAITDTTLTMYVTVDLAAARKLNAFGEPLQ